MRGLRWFYYFWFSLLTEINWHCKNLCLQPLITIQVTLWLWNYYYQRSNDSSKLILTAFKNCIRLPQTGFHWPCWYKESVQFSSVQSAQLCPTLCDPMNRSMPNKEAQINILTRKRFRDCDLPCIKFIQPASMVQDSRTPCSSNELTGNMIRHLNSVGTAVPSNQFDFWRTKSPRKVDAFVPEKERNPKQDRHALISMLWV